MFRSPDSSHIGVCFDDGIVRLVKVDGFGVDAQLAVVQVHSTHKEVSKEVTNCFPIYNLGPVL